MRRTVADAFAQTSTGATLVNMMELDLIIGSGGVLSHAPRREQAALMMIDAFAPLGVTQLAVDSIFMMPHLGVLSELDAEIAMEVFWRDCLIPLGAVVAPAGRARPGKHLLRAKLTRDDGSEETVELRGGELLRMPLGEGHSATLEIEPAWGVDVGAGRGKRLVRNVWEGASAWSLMAVAARFSLLRGRRPARTVAVVESRNRSV